MTLAVYIIEDNEVYQRLYTAIFNKLDNVELFMETTAKKGLELIKKGNPDLIILDYKLPDMNGIEICKILRKVERFKDVPIINLSYSPIYGVKEELFNEAGFDEYFEKPMKYNEIKKVLHKYVISKDIQ